MNAAEALQGEFDIRRGFEAFIDASERLEESYRDLSARAEAIDLQLAATNRELESTLVEREMVFSSLPVGLVSLDSAGAVRWCNPEAEKLTQRARNAGHNLPELADGDWELDGLNVRMQRVCMPDGGTLLLVENRSRVVHL